MSPETETLIFLYVYLHHISVHALIMYSKNLEVSWKSMAFAITDFGKQRGHKGYGTRWRRARRAAARRIVNLNLERRVHVSAPLLRGFPLRRLAASQRLRPSTLSASSLVRLLPRYRRRSARLEKAPIPSARFLFQRPDLNFKMCYGLVRFCCEFSRNSTTGKSCTDF